MDLPNPSGLDGGAFGCKAVLGFIPKHITDAKPATNEKQQPN
jgi:hypothetical protein